MEVSREAGNVVVSQVLTTLTLCASKHKLGADFVQEGT